MEKSETKKSRKQIKGVVVSDAMDKTVVVAAKNYVKHPKYSKYYTKTKRYKAHDANNEYRVGDAVYMKETTPVSKGKKFSVVSKA